MLRKGSLARKGDGRRMSSVTAREASLSLKRYLLVPSVANTEAPRLIGGELKPLRLKIAQTAAAYACSRTPHRIHTSFGTPPVRPAFQRNVLA